MSLSQLYDTFERLCSNAIFLVVVATLTIGLFLASSYQAYQNSLDTTVQSLKIDIESQTKAIATSIEAYFRGKKELVRLMTDFLLVQDYLDRVRQDSIETDPRFAELCSLLETVSGTDKEAAIAWIASLRDEYSLSFDDISYEKDGWSTRTRYWFPGTMAAEDIYFSDPDLDFETNEVCVSLVRKVYAPTTDNQPSDDVVGVAGLDLFFSPICKTMEEFAYGDARYPILISNDGSILYHPDEKFAFKAKINEITKEKEVIKSHLSDLDPVLGQFTEGITQDRTTATHLLALHQGRLPVYFGYSPVEGTAWSVGIIWQKSDAEKALRTFERTLVWSLLLNLLLFLIPIVFFSLILVNRRRRFMKMKRLYDAVMDQMQTGVAVIDPKTDMFLLMNPAYARYLEVPSEGATLFSNYRALLGITDATRRFRVSAIFSLPLDTIPETREIPLCFDGVEHYFTHHLAAFNDFTGQQLVLSVLTDVSELKKMQETLKIARDAAESASRAKGSFLANMSHEIRTPMSGIIGLTDLLATSDLDPKQREYVDLVRSSAAALLTIINDILDHSKIEAGKLLIESYTFDLRRLIQELAFSFSQTAQHKSVYFQAVVSPDVPQYVLGDANRLRQVLGNFLSNAVKFTAKGNVELRVSPLTTSTKPDVVRFEIADTGIGITENQLARLFQPFEQADVSTSRQYGGTGLGLVISKKLTEMMGGNAGCRSKYGVGSVFWCELPLPETSGTRSPSEKNVTASVEKTAHILLVDDVKVNLIVLSSMLQQWGHHIETATDGIQAIEMMKHHQYDLVFMDCQMPGMDGYECTQKIRTPETGVLDPQVPIVAVTAHAMTGDKERCLASGMDDYISKPIDQGELQSKITKWVPR
ncbi:MAG: response regulator [Planctomycetaceae bacterium]|nr:response regulator [Planctomycetaceae bacterium]